MTITREKHTSFYCLEDRKRWTPNVFPLTQTASLREKTGGYRYSVDSSVKDWRGKLVRHVSATSDRVVKSKTFELVSPLAVRWSYRYNGSARTQCDDRVVYQLYQSSFAGFPGSVSHVPLAMQRFYKACYNAASKFEGATAIAEMHETADGLKRLMQSMKDLLVSMGTAKKHPVKTLKGLSRALAGTWIGIQFGLKPIIKDVQDVLTRIYAGSLRDEFARVKAGARVRLNVSGSKQIIGAPFEGGYETPVTVRAEGLRRTRIRGEVLFRRPQDQREIFGYDPSSWILAGYESIPWSFLVDYVIPLGDFIKAKLARKTEFAWVSVTTVEEVTNTVIASAPYPVTFPTYWETQIHASSDGVLKLKTKWLIRDSAVSAPSLPRLDVTNSPFALANSVSLLILQRNKWVPSAMSYAEYLQTRKRLV